MRRTALALLPVLLAGSLAACSSGGGSDLPTASGKFGDKPKITVAKDTKAAKTLESDVLVEGDGPTVKKGDLLVADYLGETYANKKVFDNSYDRKVPAAFPIGTGNVIPAWDKVLVGAKIGSRVLMSVPPKQGYGKKGNEQAGIKGTDTLVFVVDLIARYPKSGTAQKNTPVTGLPAGLPTVEGRRRVRAHHHRPGQRDAAGGAQGHRARQGHRSRGRPRASSRSSSTPRSTSPARRWGARGSRVRRACRSAASRPARSTCSRASRPAAGCC